VCANTLAEVPHDISTQHQTENLISELEPIIASYFSPDRLDKAAIKRQIEQLIERIVSIKQKRIDDSSKEIERLQNLPENKTKFIDLDGNEVEIKNANASKEKLLKQKTDLKEKYQRLKQQWHSYKNIFNHGSVEFFDTKYFFPSVKNGFDIVIGNPPYGIDFTDDVKEYLKNRYDYLVQRIRNSFLYFIGLQMIY
jgi:adenine-specific DNA-methyltransferase